MIFTTDIMAYDRADRLHTWCQCLELLVPRFETSSSDAWNQRFQALEQNLKL